MYLSGKALKVVSGFELSSENYDNCIKILKDRVRRKHVIISPYMNKIINIEHVRNSSSLNALRRLYDDLITSVRNLEAMLVTSGSYSCMLIPMVLKKIPYDMVPEFNRKKGSKNEVVVSKLLDYIKSEVECRGSSNSIINGNQSELASSPRKSFQSETYVHTKRPVAATLATNVKVRYCCFCRNDAHDSDEWNEFNVQQKPEHLIHYLLDKCPSWNKVVRVAARCLRFIKHLRKTKDTTKTFLLTNEFEEAQNVILKYVQEEAFVEEIQRLKINKPIKTYSKLLEMCLPPYLDGSEMLRVGGRLRHVDLHENANYTVILPKDHMVTDFIIIDLKYLRAGNQLVRSAIRQLYWILCAPVAIKRIIWKCVRCARLRNALCQQLMGDLPPSRVNPSRAFSNVGVDLSGLLQVKSRKVRGIRPMKTCLHICDLHC
ncbi:hypothetical protein AVEN_119528-1 [Araneus ventricosus]|uniref:Integrase zinc-binding domain-containing protein n=1 Tax=Araneus ventricosus TaxID=182803 RepID=A0A4Y2JDU8_ARAVE|nr:hypothetical protein AVEN_119528-1 [Araneus ventricosus]